MVQYEWTFEQLEDDEIIDSDFSENLSSFKNRTSNLDVRIGLVRDEYNQDGDLEDRYWAYIVDDKLPEHFEDGAGRKINIKVPKRFHQEVGKAFINNCPNEETAHSRRRS